MNSTHAQKGNHEITEESKKEFQQHLDMIARRREQQRIFLIRQELRKPAQERVKNLLK